MLTYRSENERRPAGPKTSPPPTWQEHSFGSSCRNPVSTITVMLKHTGSILIILRSFTLTLPDVSQPIQVTALATSIDQREFGGRITVSRRAAHQMPTSNISCSLQLIFNLLDSHHSSSILGQTSQAINEKLNACIPKIPSRNH
jgi:hypothetical protein